MSGDKRYLLRANRTLLDYESVNPKHSPFDPLATKMSSKKKIELIEVNKS